MARSDFLFYLFFDSWHISEKSVHISEISLHIHASLPVFLELEGDDIVGGFLSCREARQRGVTEVKDGLWESSIAFLKHKSLVQLKVQNKGKSLSLPLSSCTLVMKKKRQGKRGKK